MDDGLLFAWAPKTVVYLASQLAIGLLVVRWLDRQPTPETSLWQQRVAIACSLALIVALAARVWVQSASAFGVADAALPENLHLIAIESRWGGDWRLQAYFAVFLLASSLLLRLGPTLWPSFALGAVGLCVVMPLLGHAADSWPRHTLHAVHNLGAAAWIGTLGILTLTAWRSSPGARASLPSLIKKFSPLALGAAATIAATGIIAGVIYVGSVDALFTSEYGRALLWKLGAVAVVAACGFTNWRGVKRGAPPARAVMTIEWLAAIVVLGLTGVLTETEHPGTEDA